MPDDVLTLAYDSALNALREQDSTISNLRNRATGLLAAAAVGTSFATALGLLNTTRIVAPSFHPGQAGPWWASSR